MPYNRRNFIQSTTSATSALLLGSLEGWAAPAPAAVQPHPDFSIGHPDGPQINDPRAPEWAECVNAHLAWWDKVGGGTEFGHPDYMPALPYTRQPVADQWAINFYMMQLLRKRYLNS